MFNFYYRDMRGFAIFDGEAFIGQILGLVISFEASTLRGAEAAFEEAVDEYLDG